MYFYFYDTIAQEQKYQTTIARMEAQLSDLGISGRREKVTLFKNGHELVEDGIRDGATTIVAVGNDQTFLNLVNGVAEHDVALGFLPIDPASRFSQILGIPPGEEACVALSRRRTITVDLGRIGDWYFLGSIEVQNTGVTLHCDDTYTIRSTRESDTISILNLGNILAGNDGQLADATNGKLTVVIAPQEETSFFRRKRDHARDSVFSTEHIRVESADKDKAVGLVVDKLKTINTPCEVDIVPQALKLIVGRDRVLQ